MRFDIARKIVKFKNGKFGIRRWTISGYEFLGLSSEEFWWPTLRDYVEKYASGTEQQVRERLRVYLQPKDPLLPGEDKGMPV